LGDCEVNSVISLKSQIVTSNGFSKNVPEKDLVKDPVKDLVKLSVNQKNIFDLIKANNNITQEELSHKIGINQRNIRNNISKLKKLNLIKRIGPDKGGHWEIVK